MLTLRANRQFRVELRGQPLFGAGALCRQPSDAEGLSGPTLRLSRRGADRAPRPLIRAAPRHRGSGSCRRRWCAQRRHARDAHVLKRFLALSPLAAKLPRRSAGAARQRTCRMCARSWRWPRSMATSR
ncbi:MAG: hypothetical protein MZW92_10970 [Comamonadaceae bacterium]|nr:hypothetical protein [Comamonadaceae bacterium]